MIQNCSFFTVDIRGRVSKVKKERKMKTCENCGQPAKDVVRLAENLNKVICLTCVKAMMRSKK